MAKKVDTTSGNLVKLIFVFTVPIILSTILQSLFSIADKVVLGNMAGPVAVASIGATGTISGLIIHGAVGLSTGTAIILARYVGQKNIEKIKQTIDTSLLTSVLLGALVGFIGVCLAPFFLNATNCPEECYNGALIYMRIYLAASPATLLFNYGSAILRSLGDTKRPLVYITIAGIINLVLNIVLCIILPEKVMAVAIATVASKAVSAILVLRRILYFDAELGLRLTRMRFNFEAFVSILRFGIPSSISNLMYPLANLQIVTAINSFGVDAVAGHSAGDSIHTISSAFSGGFGTATTTFLGQNIGAKKPERVKKAFWYMLGFSVLISGSLGVILYLTGEFWLGLILGTSSTAAIEYGMERLFFVTLFTAIAAINGVLSHAFQAFGYPLFTSVSNITFTLVFRIIWMQLIYPQNPTFTMVMSCFTVSWSLNMIFYAIVFTFIFRRYIKKGICKKI